MRRRPTRRVVQRVPLDRDPRDRCRSAAIRLDAFVRIVPNKVILHQLCARYVLQVYPMPVVAIRCHPTVVIRQVPVDLRIWRGVITTETLRGVVHDAVYELNAWTIDRKSVCQRIVKSPRLTRRTTPLRRDSFQPPKPCIRAVRGKNEGIGSRLQRCPLAIVVPHDDGRTGSSDNMAEIAITGGRNIYPAPQPDCVSRFHRRGL